MYLVNAVEESFESAENVIEEVEQPYEEAKSLGSELAEE